MLTLFYFCRAALETIDRLTDSLDLTDYASRIIHPIVRTLDTTPELRQPAMDALAALVLQLGKKFHIFIPMVNKVLNKHRIQHQRYDILMCRIIKVRPGHGEVMSSLQVALNGKKPLCYITWASKSKATQMFIFFHILVTAYYKGCLK